jgi:hypothetical protein
MNLTFKPRKEPLGVIHPFPDLKMPEWPEHWPSVVAFIGPAGCGKSTAAAHLVERGYTLLKFAHPIKEMLRVLGLEDRHLEGDQKEVPCDLLGGASPRRAMQKLGTEWGRKLIHPDIWVNAWMREAVWRLQNGQRLVIDDLRYPNELDAVLRLGGSTLRIVRKDVHQCEQHDSETQHIISQRVIVNDGTRSDFLTKVTAALDSLNPTQQAA